MKEKLKSTARKHNRKTDWFEITVVILYVATIVCAKKLSRSRLDFWISRDIVAESEPAVGMLLLSKTAAALM